MSLSARATVVKLILRPYSVAFAIFGFWFVFHKDWLLGGLFLLAWVTISLAGADLERWDKSRVPRIAKSSFESVTLDSIESNQIARVYFKNFFVLGTIGAVVLSRAGLRWYLAVPVGLLAGFAFLMIPTFVVLRRARFGK
jgi:hypothetical protein